MSVIAKTILNDKNSGSCINSYMPKTIVILILITGLLQGCASRPTATPEMDNVIELGVKPMIALEVFRDGADFYMQLLQGNHMFYAGGYREETAHKAKPASGQYPAPSLVPLQYYREKPWESLPASATSLPILGVDTWRQLRNRLFSALMSGDQTGLVMNFEHEEYFLFYDQQQQFQATRLLDKPGDYGIKGYLHFEDFIRSASHILDEFLAEKSITHNEFIVNTGDEGLYSLPLLYINSAEHSLIFFRHEPLQPASMTALPGVKSGQAVAHLLRSHLSNIYTRPVSSLFRLMTVISDTAVSTASFEWATALRQTPVPPLGDSQAMDLEAWEHDLDNMTKHPQTSGSIDFLIDGEAFFTRFIDAVSSARQSVHLQTYIFDNDDYAVQIAELLKRRSNDGVDIKVLLDGLGTIAATMTDSPSQPETHQAPVSVRQFLEQDSEVKVRQKANPWLTGDHVKSTIIDGETAFVGGMNIGREYRYDWHDLMLELHGPVVNLIDKEFDQAWSKAGLLGDLGYLFSRAKSLLEEGSETFNEITYLVGYEDISFFRKVFVRFTGLRPREYQRRFAGYSLQ